MKIVHIITKIGRGGAPIMLYKLLERLSNNTDNHIVVGLRKENKLKKEFSSLGIRTETLGLKKNILFIKDILSLKRLLKQINPDIIHSWMYHSNIIARLIAPGNSNIIWSTHHSLDDFKNEKWTTRLAISIGPYLEKSISEHIYCSRTSKVQHQKIGYSDCKSKVIPNGFDVNFFRPNNALRKTFRNQYNIPHDSIVFGQAARYHPLKNQEWLIGNFAKVHEKYPNTYLVLAGNKVTNDNSSLVDLIKRLDISTKVLLIGECTNMPAFLNAIDCYCSSSLSEAFPLVLGEAMACGIPCISTDVGDSSYIIGNCGWAVDARDDRGYINAMTEMTCLTQDQYIEIGYEARERIKNKFSLKSVAEHYYESYLKCNSQK